MRFSDLAFPAQVRFKLAVDYAIYKMDESIALLPIGSVKYLREQYIKQILEKLAEALDIVAKLP